MKKYLRDKLRNELEEMRREEKIAAAMDIEQIIALIDTLDIAKRRIKMLKHERDAYKRRLNLEQ